MDARNPHDKDLVRLVEAFNSEAGRVVARVIEADPVYESLRGVLPLRASGVDWSRAVASSGPLSGDPPEVASETTRRILDDFRAFCSTAQLFDMDFLSFVSDDYYGQGIECEVRFAPRVLEEWIPLPQGIFVLSISQIACMLVTFSRSSFVFHGSRKRQGERGEGDIPDPGG